MFDIVVEVCKSIALVSLTVGLAMLIVIALVALVKQCNKIQNY